MIYFFSRYRWTALASMVMLVSLDLSTRTQVLVFRSSNYIALLLVHCLTKFSLMLCSFLCDNTCTWLILQHKSRTSLSNKQKRSQNSYVWPIAHFFLSLISICQRERKAHNMCSSPAKIKWPEPFKIQVPSASFKQHVNKQEGNPAATKLLTVFHLRIFTWSFIEQEDCYWKKE